MPYLLLREDFVHQQRRTLHHPRRPDLMIGNNSVAITAAREALMLTPCKLDTPRSRYASAVAARVFAWVGAEDEAVTLLEQLAVLQPGLLPAEITRDPLYFIPLTENSRYRALVERLEVQIENYDAEFRKLHLDSILDLERRRTRRLKEPQGTDLSSTHAPTITRLAAMSFS